MATLTIDPREAIGPGGYDATVEIYLSDEKYNPRAGFATDGGDPIVITQGRTYYNVDSELVVDLTPNADIQPPGTYYTIIIGGFRFLVLKGSGDESLLDALETAPTPVPLDAIPYRVQHWAMTPAAVISSGLALTQNLMRLMPIVVRPNKRIDLIGCRVTNAGSGSTVLRGGIYAPGASGLPQTLLGQSATESAISTGNKQLALSVYSPTSLIWVGVVAQAVSGSPTAEQAIITHSSVLDSTFASGAFRACYTLADVDGALPGSILFTDLGSGAAGVNCGIRYGANS